MEKVSREEIIGRLFVIANETGKPIEDVVRKAKEMLEEEQKRREDAEKLLIP